MMNLKHLYCCLRITLGACLFVVTILIASCGEKDKRSNPFQSRSANPSDSTGVYVRVEKAPEYEGGLDELTKCINENLVYPDAALSRRVQGRVMVSFVVDTDGKPTDFLIVRDLGFGCDSAAINAIRACDAWKAGEIAGKAVKTKMSVPVDFRL